MDLRGKNLTELRALYRQITGRETAMRDKAKIATRLESLAETAETAVAAAKILGVEVPTRTGSSAERIRQAIESLPADEARQLLSDVGGDYLQESELRERKRETLRAIRADIADAEEQLRAVATGEDSSGDPARDLSRVEGYWRDAEELRGKLKGETAHYNDEIETIRERIKTRLDEIRQPALPGVA